MRVPKPATTLTAGNILKVSYNVLYRWEIRHRNSHPDMVLRGVRCDPIKSRDVSVGLKKGIRPGISSDGGVIHVLGDGCQGVYFECVGITLPALLDAPQACSTRNRGNIQTSGMRGEIKGHLR